MNIVAILTLSLQLTLQLIESESWTHGRQAMEDFVDEARRLLDEILQSLAKALMLDEQSFIRHLGPSDSVINVRVNCYPPCPRPDLALGLNPHTDGSLLSLIVQFDSKDGLEVLRDGRWVRIPAPPGSLLIGVGDLLEIMSNGSFESPWHRVVPHKDWERLSVTLFYYPPFKEEIGPVDGDGSSLLGEPRYKKVVVEDYVQHYYKVSPTKEKQAVLYAKLS
ncbi:hypothetical protein ACLOJK_036012 [Asimina triloba]